MENAHGGALYFASYVGMILGLAQATVSRRVRRVRLACRHFLDSSPSPAVLTEEYHPCVVSRIALLCDSVGWTAGCGRISAWLLNGL